jgi:transposase
LSVSAVRFDVTEARLAAFAESVADFLRLRGTVVQRQRLRIAVYYVLEDAFTVLLVNAQHMKNVPGRKTDVLDCAWIAQLLEHGLLRGSFVPPAPIRELRDLTRYRMSQP